MSSRTFTLPSGIEVPIIKNSRSKNLRLSVNALGKPRLSMPKWVTYRQAEKFLLQKQDWLEKNTPRDSQIYHNMTVGKYHRLEFKPGNYKSVRTKMIDTLLVVTYPSYMVANNDKVQRAAEKICYKALLAQAEKLLPQRIASLSKSTELEYSSLKIKQLRSRWGSCSSNKLIMLNSLLMQLEWEEIDYVIYHELVHTKFMSHSKYFWDKLYEVYPKARSLRKQVSAKRPVLNKI